MSGIGWSGAFAAAVGLLALAGPGPAAASEPGAGRVPNYWDTTYRSEAPDLSARRAIRFLAEAESPPFSFLGADGLPTGFHVELARAICGELDMPCTIQTLRWDLLRDGLDDERGDAIIASMRIDEESRARFAFSHTYLARPARFVARRDAESPRMTPEGLAGHTVAVAADTAHEAYLRDFFAEADVRPFDDAGEARAALREGAVDALFGDGLNLSLWLNGAASRDCCAFRGGPYTESRYFGEGFAVAVAPGDDELKQAFDYALARLHASGAYREIYLRYFPVSFY